jgi:predicted HAD superfamily Cof-like phosphohydrolase
MNYIKKVKKFHKTFNQPILENPQIPSKERCNLRVSLLEEELGEFKEAIERGDMVEVLDSLTDLMYVLNGAIIEFGLSDIFDQSFKEVQRSNMSKACNDLDEVNQTMKFYGDRDGVESYSVSSGDKYIVYRKGDNKVLKSVNYSPADLKKILNL